MSAAEKCGINTTAVVSSMEDPLGMAVGNALEVEEAVECLRGKGPEDLEDLVAVLGGILVGGKDGEIRIREAISSGKAIQKVG